MSVQTTYLDKPAKCFAGMRSSQNPGDLVDTFRNVESSAEIAFGLAVCFDLSTPVTDKDALLPAAETNKVAGIVLHSHSHSNGTGGDLGTTGLKVGALMDVMRRGRVWVYCRLATAVGDRLWVRAVSGGGAEVLGGIENADDSTDMIDCTKQGVFVSSCDAGGFAELEVDFTNEPD